MHVHTYHTHHTHPHYMYTRTHMHTCALQPTSSEMFLLLGGSELTLKQLRMSPQPCFPKPLVVHGTKYHSPRERALVVRQRHRGLSSSWFSKGRVQVTRDPGLYLLSPRAIFVKTTANVWGVRTRQGGGTIFTPFTGRALRCSPVK